MGSGDGPKLTVLNGPYGHFGPVVKVDFTIYLKSEALASMGQCQGKIDKACSAQVIVGMGKGPRCESILFHTVLHRNSYIRSTADLQCTRC